MKNRTFGGESLEVIVDGARMIYDIYKKYLKETKGIKIEEFDELFKKDGLNIDVYIEKQKHEESIVLAAIFKGLDCFLDMLNAEVAKFLKEESK